MRLIGLTGGIACGKSTVSNFLSDEGYVVVDLDKIVQNLQRPGTRTTMLLARAFPDTFIKGTLDREKLGARVFRDANERRKLNAIMRKPIALALLRKISWHWCLGTPVLILDAPLLYETKLDKLCAWVVVIATSEKKQIERIVKRDKILIEDARRRIHAQMPLSIKCKHARFVIHNSADSFFALKADVNRLLLPRLQKHVILLAPWRLNSLPGLLVVFMLLFFSSLVF
mmetsp:Transcript_19995/g.25869  ORF Transcript_19995/g.25869 Transcript_19995/m.25869 type:complete len:228 (+) Transcript_19995:60-743(+)